MFIGGNANDRVNALGGDGTFCGGAGDDLVGLMSGGDVQRRRRNDTVGLKNSAGTSTNLETGCWPRHIEATR